MIKCVFICVQLDIAYIEKKSLLTDIAILFRTVIQMFSTSDNGAF
ncbi:sugar transferase [Leuconostoc pseudomesenteroides]|nr:sugar transferase [Leuconostoc pseudomesenteroides]